ncbi:MAG: bifunctional methionine sulfoxide reductase B/A protein [Lentisphaeria bacterium]
MSKIGIAQSPYEPLNESEKQVLLLQGTERPFSGKYHDFFALGIYCCRKCGAPLYYSDDKFSSGCGWPAFDDEIPGAVKRLQDADGRRTEIRCASCQGHLGHIFHDENLTAKNTRHCVNSVSLVFEPQPNGRLKQAVFAGGCFWGVEVLLQSQTGVLAAISGYSGGTLDNPSYRQVCTGQTGHMEAVSVIYDSQQTDFEKLCRYFLEIHDPTQQDRQGPDLGKQYASAIFYLDSEQQQSAYRLVEILRKKGYDMQTRILPFQRFWQAEKEHQDYYQKNGKQPYCHRWQKKF